MVGLFLGIHLYLAGSCCKNALSARGSALCKSGPEIACLVSVTIYCTIFSNDSTPPRWFLRTKYFLKKYLEKMLIEQIIESQLRGVWAPWPYMYFYNRLTS